VLIDTGSNITIAGSRIANKYRWKVRTSELKSARIANGEPIIITGVAHEALMIGNIAIRSHIYVTPDIDDMILGVDWLKKRGRMTWDFETHHVRFGDDEWIKLQCESDLEPRLGCVSLRTVANQRQEAIANTDPCRVIRRRPPNGLSKRPPTSDNVHEHNEMFVRKCSDPYAGDADKLSDDHKSLSDSVEVSVRDLADQQKGDSDMRLNVGREVRMPVDVVYGSVEDPANESYDDYVENIRERMTSAYEEARQALRKKAAERNKRYYDVRVRPNKFKKGETGCCTSIQGSLLENKTKGLGSILVHFL